MRSTLSRLISLHALLLLLTVTAAGQNPPGKDAPRLLPPTVGDFRVQGERASASALKIEPADYAVTQLAEGAYVNGKGGRLTVTVVRTETQAGAYALLSEVSAQMKGAPGAKVEEQGEQWLAGIESADRAAFYKGRTFVHVAGKGAPGGGPVEFARAFAQTVEGGENELPFLIRHLPEWETAQHGAVYAVTLPALQRAVGRQPVLDVVTFDKGTEAVMADYGPARLVIVEYATPQIAESSDARIRGRIEELRGAGQPTPSGYRRVGNYSVFVFGAQDEVAAAQLIDQVKYEQRIQWLNENPFAWQAYQEQNTQKAVSLILGIAKTVGFFLAICLGAGGIFGGIFFLHRRTQQRAAEADRYSDAGGMLRLNLDDMTPETDPARLLSSGDGKAAV